MPPTTPTTQHTVRFTRKKETKGAIQYEEDGHDTNPLFLVGTLYLRKAGLAHAGVAPPDRVTITLDLDPKA